MTGGTTGIDRAIAVLLASEGPEVFLCGRNEGHLNDALARIEEVGQGSGVEDFSNATVSANIAHDRLARRDRRP